MKTLLYCFLIIAALSCKSPDSDISDIKEDTVPDEYPDWYTLKAPVDNGIRGVWGNYDKTVVISTGAKLFRTEDQGRHWKQVYESTAILFGIVFYQDTLFAMNGLAIQPGQDISPEFLITPDSYSADDGKSWKRYRGGNPVLYQMPELESAVRFSINPVVAPGKDTYRINKIYRDGPNATSGPTETPGVITSKGKRIDLPQLHQIQSLFLDDQQRLYIAGTDAVCGLGMDFKFCNSQGGRGVVYISKKSNP
jgi:hypothetical protein